MKKALVATLLLLTSVGGWAQTKITGLQKIRDGLYVMYYDSTKQKRIITKSLVAEFRNYVVLMEMPITNGGSGEAQLRDHTEGGEAVLQALKRFFPKKPLKYVLSTHWHPHSLSSALPFLAQGVTLVTTEGNFKMLHQFIDSAALRRYRKQIVFVDDKGLSIGDKGNTIKIFKLNRKEYPHLPTEEFLFFYLPKYNCLHNSCMFQRFAGYRVLGKEMVSTRVEDLDKFIAAQHLSPAYLITTDTYWDGAGGYVPGDTLRKMMQTGLGMSALASQLLRFDEEILSTKTDSVLKYLMDNRIPYSIVNMAVYEALRKNERSKALAIARLQVLFNPSSANSWDTYGEVYYFMGELKMAKKYEAESKRIDKSFEQGGEATWKQDLETYRAGWAEKK
jgi:hypothetical protein